MTSKPNRRSAMMDKRRIVAERLDCSLQSAWLWLTSDSIEKQRRADAALAATRTDFTHPSDGMAEWLMSRHGVSIAEVSKWYGYHFRTLSEIIGNGRFREDKPHRAWTLIDYYLKENGYEERNI